MTKKDVSDIEGKIMCDEISRAQVFTQMRQLIDSLEKECTRLSAINNEPELHIHNLSLTILDLESKNESLKLDYNAIYCECRAKVIDNLFGV
jgi:hypothetical protein